MKSLEEFIKRCEKAVELNRAIADNPESKNWIDIAQYKKHAEEHRLLADWLKELKEYKENLGQCKDCKYFEHDSVAELDGMPLIVAHENCSKWGNGCKTKENGYCFLFERKTKMNDDKKTCRETIDYEAEIDFYKADNQFLKDQVAKLESELKEAETAAEYYKNEVSKKANERELAYRDGLIFGLKYALKGGKNVERN